MDMKRLLLSGLIAGSMTMGAPALATADEPRAAACPAPLERWTEISLYLGRNIAGIGEVTEYQFRNFLREVVTPRFPDGLTVLDAAGQFRDGARIIRERTKLLILLVPDAAEVRGKVAAVVSRYKTRFRQQSVLHTENSLCLSFD
jgi:hypothetical protein